MHQLLYVSEARPGLIRADIAEILRVSRLFNARNDITGLLLFADSSFLQVLEGERAVVEELYARIRRDERHFNVTTILSEARAGRVFGDWRMGYDEPGEDSGEARDIVDLARERARRAPLRPAEADLVPRLREFYAAHPGRVA